MLARVRSGLRLSSDGLTKATLQAAKVSRHVREPDRETLVRAKNDIGHLGRSFLNLFQRMAIKTELERVLGSRMAGELRIEDLVTPGAERGRPIDPFEKVGDPMPAVCHKTRPDKCTSHRNAWPPRLRRQQLRSSPHYRDQLRSRRAPPSGVNRGNYARAQHLCEQSNQRMRWRSLDE